MNRKHHGFVTNLYLVMAAMLVVLLLGCSDQPTTGPKEVKWDRDACERCRMVLSDRKHSAQVRWLSEGKRSRVLKFDDIGCAVLWLEDKPWKGDPTTEIWVTDHRDGKWIDARTATYVEGHVTPMEYGLGAQSDPTADGLDFTRAVGHIQQLEKRFNAHGANLLEMLQERTKMREMKH